MIDISGIRKATHIFICLGIATFSNAALAQSDVNEGITPMVVELFTSQGCASCPPADTLLASLAQNPALLPLSFHVDYWDRMGWKDPFSHASFTKRQALYNRTLDTPGSYTPQIVVNGMSETIGSHNSAVHSLIAEVKGYNIEAIPITLRPEEKGLMIILPEISPFPASADIWLIGYDNQRTTYISSGENRGKQLSSYNVVRYLDRVGSYEGKALSLHIQLHWPEETDHVAVLLQEPPAGKILGAMTLPVKKCPTTQATPCNNNI